MNDERETAEQQYTVGRLARLAGVTVRTLHHYDEIGLLVPTHRTRSGYRLYDRTDLERLHQIRLWRHLGVSLDRIRALLTEPNLDRRKALQEQRRALLERIDEDRKLVGTIDALLNPEDTVSDEQIFAGFDPQEHHDEAQRTWGDTDLWKESQRRMATYDQAQMAQMKAETNAPYAELAELRAQGQDPGSMPCRLAAERHRLAIDRWVYPCNSAQHLALATLYESDPRFARSIDAFGDDLTAYVTAAIRANAEASPTN